MDHARWRRIEQLFHEARQLSGSAREAFLDRACARDADLRATVTGMLDASPGADAFLASLLRLPDANQQRDC